METITANSNSAFLMNLLRLLTDPKNVHGLGHATVSHSHEREVAELVPKTAAALGGLIVQVNCDHAAEDSIL